jgi:hypothetical protein
MRATPLFLLLLTAAPAEAAQQTVGVYGQWGAFKRDNPRHCYAIAEPYSGPRSRDAKPFASVGSWPGKGIKSQIHFRLSRDKRDGSAVLLKIADRTFQMLAGKRDAWAADPTADAQIVAAMRSGVDMTIETRAANGALVRNSYRLQGAATAIDAAAIACAR